MTFRQWNARSCRLANALLGLGLGKGNRVAVLAYNCVEWLEIYAATAGLVTVPVNFRLVGSEIAYIVENCEAAAFIVEDALVETVEQVRAELSVPTQNSPMPFRVSRLRGLARSRARRRARREGIGRPPLDVDVHFGHHGSAQGRDPQPSRRRKPLAHDRSRDGPSGTTLRCW
jgi:acyl-CoA synthetase (AMP-forming)/AMP-acid ligase II